MKNFYNQLINFLYLFMVAVTRYFKPYLYKNESFLRIITFFNPWFVKGLNLVINEFYSVFKVIRFFFSYNLFLGIFFLCIFFYADPMGYFGFNSITSSIFPILLGTILFSFIFHIFSDSSDLNLIRNRTLFFLGLIWVESVILFSVVFNAYNNSVDGGLAEIGNVMLFGHEFFYFFEDSSSIFSYVPIKINFSLGMEPLSVFFVLLTTFLFFFCFLNTNIKKDLFNFVIFYYLLLFLLILLFSVVDLFLFYIIFEIIIIPMFFIIGIWGAREDRVTAAYYFFFFTLVGSLVMLLSIIYIYALTGDLHYYTLYDYEFSYKTQLILWPAFFLAFGIKMPIFPLHIWLPKAHGEAPTIGSVLLAGILLKLGGYGFIKFSLKFFPEACFFYMPLVFLIGGVGILYTSIITLSQIDLKKIIAYSSIGHMNLALIGIFSMDPEGLLGSLFLMIAHGFSSPALFMLVGSLYDRYHTRNLYYYGGLVQYMPLFTIFFLLFTFCSIGFPGTLGFLGEIFILVSCFKVNHLFSIFLVMSLFFVFVYSLWLLQRLCFGANFLNLFYTPFFSRFKFFDLYKREFLALFPLFLISVILGLCPEAFEVFTSFFLFLLGSSDISTPVTEISLSGGEGENELDIKDLFPLISLYIKN